MSDLHTAIRVFLTLVVLAEFVWCLVMLVRRARRGGKGIHAIGAMLMLFGWGNLRDPSNNTVAEANDGRIRKGTSSGDPLDEESR